MSYIDNMKFRIINLSDGSQKDCFFEQLSTSLIANCEILRVEDDELEAIGFVSHKTLVFFAVEFMEYALRYCTNNILPEVQTCIDLVYKWIKDQSSVSKEELYFAVEAADDAVECAVIAYADANAAYADYADYEAYDAAYVAAYAVANADYAPNRAAAYVALAAADAAYAAAASAAYAAASVAVADAADAAGKNKLGEQNRQATYVLNFFGVECDSVVCTT